MACAYAINYGLNNDYTNRKPNAWTISSSSYSYSILSISLFPNVQQERNVLVIRARQVLNTYEKRKSVTVQYGVDAQYAQGTQASLENPVPKLACFCYQHQNNPKASLLIQSSEDGQRSRSAAKNRSRLLQRSTCWLHGEFESVRFRFRHG